MAPLYKDILQSLLCAYEAQRLEMSLKVNFLHSHIEYFPGNLGACGEEQGKRFNQIVHYIERRYQGRWNVNMLQLNAEAGKRRLKTKPLQRKEEKVSKTKKE